MKREPGHGMRIRNTSEEKNPQRLEQRIAKLSAFTPRL